MILILADADDSHLPYVTEKLTKRSVEYAHCNPHEIPQHGELIVEYQRDGAAQRLLRYKNKVIDLSAVSAVWNRGRARPVARVDAANDQRWWIEEVYARWLPELWECVDCLWIPTHPIANHDPRRHFRPRDTTHVYALPDRLRLPSPYNKMHQLAVAAGLGFTIPRTVVTNQPSRAIEFYNENGGHIVSKNAEGLRVERNGETRRVFTYPVRRRDLANYQAVCQAPVVFQERIPKKIELRVTVVGRKVFAAGIASQNARQLQHDWRHYHDFGGDQYYSVYDLPPKIEQLCVRVVEELGLCCGALDLIVTPDNEYVFLEINPNGQWAWIEDFTGMPIADAICDLLVCGRV